MLHEDINALNGIIEQQIKLVENTPEGEERDRAIDSLCKLLSKSNDAWKIYAEEINNDARLQNDRIKTETEAEIRTNQNKNDRLKSFFDISKHVLSVAAFVAFEIMAHESEMNDVMPRNLMHPSKNPIKLRL